MKELGDFINESKRNAESTEKMVEISSRLINKVPGGLLTPSRKFVKEGEILFNSKGSSKAAHLHLFNDMLLVSKPKGEKFKVLFAFDLEEIFAQELLPVDSKKKDPLMFKVVGNIPRDPKSKGKDNSPLKKAAKTEVILAAHSESERECWVNDLMRQSQQQSSNRDSFRRASLIVGKIPGSPETE